MGTTTDRAYAPWQLQAGDVTGTETTLLLIKKLIRFLKKTED
jgi:hypothetical protein